jgi:hypothetical protein
METWHIDFCLLKDSDDFHIQYSAFMQNNTHEFADFFCTKESLFEALRIIYIFAMQDIEPSNIRRRMLEF